MLIDSMYYLGYLVDQVSFTLRSVSFRILKGNVRDTNYTKHVYLN